MLNLTTAKLHFHTRSNFSSKDFDDFRILCDQFYGALARFDKDKHVEDEVGTNISSAENTQDGHINVSLSIEHAAQEEMENALYPILDNYASERHKYEDLKPEDYFPVFSIILEQDYDKAALEIDFRDPILERIITESNFTDIELDFALKSEEILNLERFMT